MPRVVPDDPKDDVILLTAIGGKADVLATRDRHFADSAVSALAVGHGLRILSDDQLLTEL